jgi:ATP-binding cassette subfamily B protein
MNSYFDEAENEKARFDLGVWRWLYSYARRRPRVILGLMGFGFLTAAMDICLPLVTRAVIRDVEEGRSVDWLGYSLLYGLITLALVASIFGFIRFAGTLRAHVAHDIRKDAFARLQELSFRYFDTHSVGWLMARLTSDCERLSMILAWCTLDIVWGGTMLLGISAVMLVIEPLLGAVVIAVLPVLAIASAWFQKRILTSAREVRKANSQLTASYNEGIQGARTSKAFVREQANLRDFGVLADQMYAASVRNAVQSAAFFPTVLTLGSLATGLALAFGGVQVLGGALSIATLILFLQYSRQFFQPIEDLSHWFAELQMAQASAERIRSLIQEIPEVRDLPERLRTEPAPKSFERIRFENVRFRYGNGPYVLDGLDFEVRRGESIALVGPTGGGKSTIVNVLCRFYEPSEGAVLFDGIDYRQRELRWLQSRLGIVLQSPQLFRGTIEENVRYGKRDASSEELERASRLAGLDDVLSELPSGWESEVGEGGMLLSTGQRQLVSFARAILKAPEILVMDEATSSIDTETEQRIQRGIEHVLEGRTSFVIAHRLSTIRDCDRILFIEGGKIVESGSHAELLAKSGRYKELYEDQRLREAAVARW